MANISVCLHKWGSFVSNFLGFSLSMLDSSIIVVVVFVSFCSGIFLSVSDSSGSVTFAWGVDVKNRD